MARLQFHLALSVWMNGAVHIFAQSKKGAIKKLMTNIML